MAEKTVVLTLNLKTSFQGGNSRSNLPQGSKDEIDKATFSAVNYVIQDITFKAAKNQQRNIQNQLESKLTGIVMSELNKMGRKIATQAIGLGPGARWPKGGSLELEGQPSRALTRLDPSTAKPMSIKAVTGQWRARTQEYLRRKAKKFGHRKWWENSGDLKRELERGQMYIGAYGPVRVSWIPERIEKGFSAASSALRFSTIARGQGRSYTVTTGHIRLSVLGRITQQMLNSPGLPSYDSRFNGLLNSLPESVERKLAGKGDPYRSIMEPFLTFYLNRQIPNRIWGEIERSIKPIGVTKTLN